MILLEKRYLVALSADEIWSLRMFFQGFCRCFALFALCQPSLTSLVSPIHLLHQLLLFFKSRSSVICLHI